MWHAPSMWHGRTYISNQEQRFEVERLKRHHRLAVRVLQHDDVRRCRLAVLFDFARDLMYGVGHAVGITLPAGSNASIKTHFNTNVDVN